MLIRIQDSEYTESCVLRAELRSVEDRSLKRVGWREGALTTAGTWPGSTWPGVRPICCINAFFNAR